MKRKLLLLSLTLVLAFSGVVYAAGVNGSYKGKDIVRVTQDGKEVKPDGVPGYIEGEYTMVPLGMLRKMGVTVEWNQKTLTANVKLPTRTVPVLIQSQLDELSKAVYEVNTPPTKDHPNGGRASAFKIGEYVVTNAHVGSDAPYVSVKIDGEWQRSTEYAFVNTDSDVMGFRLSSGKSLPYSTELPIVGDPVYTISFPHGELKITEGEVYGITQGPHDVTQIVHTAITDSGGSGGMLLDGKGRVIGMNRSVMLETSFAIPISYVLGEIQ